MKILILGAGKMGSFFCDLLSFKHEVAILDSDPKKLRFVYNVLRFSTYQEVAEFKPEMVINCVTLNHTLQAFKDIIPYLKDETGSPRKDCIISDIASVKTGLRNFYIGTGFRFCSVHPMFGPTFATMDNLSRENAIIINEEGITDETGISFYRELFESVKLNIREYTFKQHDEVVAYSLSIPFASTLVFGSIMKHQDAPGTTFKRHLAIARGLLSEDDFLLTEILFNPHTPQQLSKIIDSLQKLKEIVCDKDSAKMKVFLDGVRRNVE